MLQGRRTKKIPWNQGFKNNSWWPRAPRNKQYRRRLASCYCFCCSLCCSLYSWLISCYPRHYPQVFYLKYKADARSVEFAVNLKWKCPPLLSTGVTFTTGGHFYLGESGHCYLGLTRREISSCGDFGDAVISEEIID